MRPCPEGAQPVWARVVHWACATLRVPRAQACDRPPAGTHCACAPRSGRVRGGVDNARHSAWAGRTQSRETPWPRDPRPSTWALGPRSRFPLCLIQLLLLAALGCFSSPSDGPTLKSFVGGSKDRAPDSHNADVYTVPVTVPCCSPRAASVGGASPLGTRPRAPDWLVPPVLRPRPGPQTSHLPADPCPAGDGGSQHPAWALRCSRPQTVSPGCLLRTQGSSFCSSSPPAEMPGIPELGFAGAETWVRPDPTAYWLRDLERVP